MGTKRGDVNGKEIRGVQEKKPIGPVGCMAECKFCMQMPGLKSWKPDRLD